MHNPAKDFPQGVLRHRGTPVGFRGNCAEKFTNCKNPVSFFVSFRDTAQNFCEKPPKIISRIIFAGLGILFLSHFNRRNSMQGKVEICGVNTSRLNVLTPEEMDQLLRRAKTGDEAARERLIEGNLRLVLSVIQRFDKRGENLGV